MEGILKTDLLLAGLRKKQRQRVYVGLVLLIVSFTLYAITDLFAQNSKDDYYFTIFVLHYTLAIGYTFYLVTQGAIGVRKSWRRENLDETAIVLQMYLISAYALNRELTVFQTSVTWLSVFIIISSAAMVIHNIVHELPVWLERLRDIIQGAAIIFYIYLIVYIAPIYFFGLAGTLLLGVGAHAFVPVFLLTWSVFNLIHRACDRKVRSLKWVLIGSVLVLFYVASFVTEWVIRTERIETLINGSVLHPKMELPTWVRVGQSVKKDWVTRRILKNEIIYSTPDRWGDFTMSGRWNEGRQHDPLVFVANYFKALSISQDDRIKILHALAESRHKSEEQLWSGNELSTSYIVSDIDLYPELRLAYTEKYLTIHANERTWRSQQEAIYTFQLPEGSVVTSLSLWVDGEERKGILTSKEKATTAYNTIVGVERRDPSVVHWREGNTVAVRVFPCTRSEDRKFKIGITSPLIQRDGKLHYQKILFDGPTVSDALETMRVNSIGKSTLSGLSREFIETDGNEYVREGKYDPDFELSFDVAKPIPQNQFSFGDYSYSISQNEYVFKPMTVSSLFLDINDQWKGKELDIFRIMVDTHDISVFYNNQFIKLTEENWDEITDSMTSLNFSLFPYHLITNPSQALVVTKGRPFTPYLADIKETQFGQELIGFLKNRAKVKVYNLGTDVSTYTASLREFRAFDFAGGPVAQIQQWLHDRHFPEATESEHSVVLHDANLRIQRMRNNGLPNTAPDHVARLFAYNEIMRNAGEYYFSDKADPVQLVKLAQQAYVVSPVSSLIVLETQNDYDRFNIHNGDESLMNAAKNSSGAVPEPHEWVLFGIALAFVLMTLRNRRINLNMLWRG